MNLKLDFVLHWLWTIAYILLILSGIAMMGAKYSWILDYKLGYADVVHRISASIFVILSCIAIFYEMGRAIKNNTKKLVWGIFGDHGYQLFNFITSLIFIVTGTLIWICMDSFETAAAFALYIHEKLTYIAIASVIWHIYKKCHALIIPKKNFGRV